MCERGLFLDYAKVERAAPTSKLFMNCSWVVGINFPAGRDKSQHREAENLPNGFVCFGVASSTRSLLKYEFMFKISFLDLLPFGMKVQNKSTYLKMVAGYDQQPI